MKIKDVRGISVLYGGPHSGMHALGWHDAASGDRFHVWVDWDSKAIRRERTTGLMAERHAVQVYRNPPLGNNGKALVSGQHGYFRTRKLDGESKAWAPIVEHVLGEAKRLGLFAAAEDERRVLEEGEERERQRRLAEKRAQEAGPALLAAARLFAERMAVYVDPSRSPQATREAHQALLAAIALAETGEPQEDLALIGFNPEGTEACGG